MPKRPTLLVVPSLQIVRDRHGGLRIPRKFLDGVATYSRLWPGPVRVWMSPRDRPTTNLDEMAYDPAAWPFEVGVGPAQGAEADQAIADADLVLGSIGFPYDDLPARCRRLGTPCVLVTENTLRTRLQIAAAEETNPVRRLKRNLWERRQERRNLAAVRAVAGVQANGTPTYDAYRAENPNTLLFFDSRVSDDMLPDENRVRSRPIQGPLRLAFSGRFVAIKGVDHLVEVARRLAGADIDFRLDLFGDGPLTDGIRAQIAEAGLSNRVRLGGVLEFSQELVPTMSREVELFVCPHRQGDPSCTYLETMGCGVPIVGYDNEAFAGLRRESGLGWTTPLNDPNALAARIAELARDRAALRETGVACLRFARSHTFENTFARRIDHLRQTLDLQRGPTPTSREAVAPS